MARTFQKERAGAKPRRSSAYKTHSTSRSKFKKRGAQPLRTRLALWGVWLLLFGTVAGTALAVGGYLGLVRAVSGLPEPANITSHPTYIHSAPLGNTEGSTRVIGTIFEGENRRTATLEEMPQSLLNALVAKEDQRFREHGGVDLWGIMRALYVDIREGEAVEGASTITQQYVKNAYLSGDRTIARKLKEALIAVELERRYEKDEILANYLNTVYFGNNAYGAGAAAETYFNKSIEDLTIGESAALIGLLWSPSTLGTNRDGALQQRDLVLEQMRDAGYITRQDHMEAIEEDLPEKWPAAPMIETGLTGPPETRNFTEMVQDELVQNYGANTVRQGGMSVYTTLDLQDQLAAQETLYGAGGYIPNPDDPDAALVSIEPETGHITAMVGNRDQDSHFNLVTQARRQPGSSFKPFALIAALEQGISPDTHFVSEDKRYNLQAGAGAEVWKVENFEEKERGSISLREALWQSDNTVFTDLMMNIDGRGLINGPQQVADVAHRLGITSDLGDHPSMVLGSKEVSPLEMATAYATIANGGKKVTPTAVTRVVLYEEQENEKMLYEESPNQGEQVISPDVAAEATEIMVGDITNGIARNAALGERPAAGKTGTSESFFDAWFVGYTPQLVTGVWMGYAEGGQTLENLLGPEGEQLGRVGSPTKIWNTYMLRALAGEPIERFEGVNAPQTAGTATGDSEGAQTSGNGAQDPPGSGSGNANAQYGGSAAQDQYDN